MKKLNIKRILLFLMLLLIGVTIIYYGLSLLTKEQEEKSIYQIDNYNYELKEKNTQQFKDLFQELDDILSNETVNKEEYAILVSKLFIVDFYSLDNKITKNDIGGVQFIHSDIIDNFILNTENTLYKYIQSNIYNDRTQELPTVIDVEVLNIENINYLINDKEESAYSITIKWEYDKDLGYQDEAIIFILKEDKKLSIVELR